MSITIFVEQIIILVCFLHRKTIHLCYRNSKSKSVSSFPACGASQTQL